jgi:endonuclease/exonuclease/phosphatase family metal-dependent hydrolase
MGHASLAIRRIEPVRLLIWNLFHGRAVPGAGHDLLDEFRATLAGWRWDVALLQEVPPWWSPDLARACDADERTALTSRNALPALRRAIAIRLPDVIKSNGGGANAILVRRRFARIADHRTVVLRHRPERRVCHAVKLNDGAWIANLHAEAHGNRAPADIARAAAATLGWAQGAPALLGGDFNVRAPAVPGWSYLGGHHVDHALGHAMTASAPIELLDARPLSDHVPLVIDATPRERGTVEPSSEPRTTPQENT